MNRLGVILILSMNMIHAMNSDIIPVGTDTPVGKNFIRPCLMRRAFSDSSLLSHRLSDSEVDPDESTDEDQLIDDLRAHKRSLLHGLRITGADADTPRKSEATYDDVVQQIQFLSKVAFTEARLLNRESLDALFTQLQREATTLRTQIGNSLGDLNTRLEQVEKLLPLVDRLMEQEKILYENYDQTCIGLVAALEKCTTEVRKQETTVTKLLRELRTGQKKTKEMIDTIDERTLRTADHARETYASVRSHLWKDKFLRNACSITTSLGVLALIIWCFRSNHAPAVTETNASLQ